MRNDERFAAAIRCVAPLLLVALLAGPARGQEEYRIGGGDVLQVNVWKNTELSQTVTVRPDGRITLPLIRDVVAAGLTAAELGNVVAEKLSAFVNAPNVTITVMTATSYRVYSQGAVAAGMHVLAAPTTARQLLSLAGPVAPLADLGRSHVLRGSERLPVDLSPGGPGSSSSPPDVQLHSGDVLVVPFREESAAPRVLVAGEVATPQAMPFEEGMTVLDAFLRAGGGTPAAELRGARIARSLRGGERGEVKVDLEGLWNRGDLSLNVKLQPGDVIVVPRRPDAGRVLIAGEVQTPRSLPFADGMTALDAFVEAGGASDFADLDSAKVVRKAADGKRAEIPVDFDRILKRGDLSRNVELRPGDVVVVPR